MISNTGSLMVGTIYNMINGMLHCIGKRLMDIGCHETFWVNDRLTRLALSVMLVITKQPRIANGQTKDYQLRQNGKKLLVGMRRSR